MAFESTDPKSDDIVVFQVLRDSACAECGDELWKGRLLRLEKERPLCMSCADLAHLVFPPRGDAALTRRAGRYSSLQAVVVRFSRSRNRYERQGVLVEEAALARAEQECLADSDGPRACSRTTRGTRCRNRHPLPRRVCLAHPPLVPGVPRAGGDRDRGACLPQALRACWSKADAKQFDPEMITLAVRAHVRHVHTDYDHLLGTGWERHKARDRVLSRVDRLWAMEL